MAKKGTFLPKITWKRIFDITRDEKIQQLRYSAELRAFVKDGFVKDGGRICRSSFTKDFRREI